MLPHIFFEYRARGMTINRKHKNACVFHYDPNICSGFRSIHCNPIINLWLQENTCNEEAPPSIFNVCSPSLWIIRTFFSYFLRKTNKWIGSVLFSPSLNSSNHFSLCVFLGANHLQTVRGSALYLLQHSVAQLVGGEGVMVIGLPYPFFENREKML